MLSRDSGGGIFWATCDPDELAPWPDRAAAAVWLGRTDAAQEARPAPTPTDRCDALLHPPARRPGFLHRRATARLCLARWLALPEDDLVLAYDEHRRPVLQGPAAPFRVSGASRGPWQAVALARTPVGVDVELVAEAEPAWAVLGEEERVRLQTLPEESRAAAFLLLWTAKEAALKALGIGLAREPAEIAAEALSDGRLAISDCGQPMSLLAAEARTENLGGAKLQAACVVLEPQ